MHKDDTCITVIMKRWELRHSYRGIER